MSLHYNDTRGLGVFARRQPLDLAALRFPAPKIIAHTLVMLSHRVALLSLAHERA